MIGPPLSQNTFEDFEKVSLVLKLQVDFQPGQVQRRNGFCQMVRAINPIFFRCDQQVGAVHARLMRQTLQLKWLIGVVVVK